MKKIAIDTNIAIDILNNRTETIDFLLKFNQIFIPIIATGELLFGAINSGKPSENLDKFRLFIARCHPLPVTDEVAEVYASVRLALKKKGTPIPENDIWIAAICIANKIPPLTKDKHFSNIEDLELLGL